MKKLLWVLCLSVAWVIPALAVEAPTPTIDTPYIYVSETYIPPKTPQNRLGEDFVKKVGCSCVLTAKALMGRFNEVWGTAYLIKPNADFPYIGGAVLTNEGNYGHVAYIENIVGDTLFLREGNYVPCQITTRILSMKSPVIRGFLKP